MLQRGVRLISGRFSSLPQREARPDTSFSQIRLINQCIHIKGIPLEVSREEIYSLMKDYGKVTELAAYPEAPNYDKDDPEATQTKRKHYITHDRLPGQTAVVRFENIKSAIMCKEELHWRPFPHKCYNLTKEIIETNPRNRPIVNILFETSILSQRLRPWVRRDLGKSQNWIAKQENGLLNGRKWSTGNQRTLKMSLFIKNFGENNALFWHTVLIFVTADRRILLYYIGLLSVSYNKRMVLLV